MTSNNSISKVGKYPECEKLKAVSDKSQEIGAFLDWLQSQKKVVLATYLPTDDLMPMRFSMEELLAEYYEVDLKKVEKERRAILKALQNKGST